MHLRYCIDTHCTYGYDAIIEKLLGRIFTFSTKKWVQLGFLDFLDYKLHNTPFWEFHLTDGNLNVGKLGETPQLEDFEAELCQSWPSFLFKKKAPAST